MRPAKPARSAIGSAQSRISSITHGEPENMALASVVDS
jgi:hypothetical protein